MQGAVEMEGRGQVRAPSTAHPPVGRAFLISTAHKLLLASSQVTRLVHVGRHVVDPHSLYPLSIDVFASLFAKYI